MFTDRRLKTFRLTRQIHHIKLLGLITTITRSWNISYRHNLRRRPTSEPITLFSGKPIWWFPTTTNSKLLATVGLLWPKSLARETSIDFFMYTILIYSRYLFIYFFVIKFAIQKTFHSCSGNTGTWPKSFHTQQINTNTRLIVPVRSRSRNAFFRHCKRHCGDFIIVFSLPLPFF